MVLGDVLASFSNLRHVSFFGIRLLNSTTLPITATHMTLQNFNSLTFTSLLQCATNLKDLELYGNEFSSIPLSLTLKSPNLKQFTYNNSTNNLDSTTSAIFFKELAKFISSFPNLEVIDLWIPHYDSSLVQMTLLEEADFLDAIPSSIISIDFLGAGSPSAQAFQRASHRWNNLESIRFGVNAWKGIENCCGWTEKEIRSLEFPKVYYSVNEGRRFSSTFTDLPTPVYAHTYVIGCVFWPRLFADQSFDFKCLAMSSTKLDQDYSRNASLIVISK